MSERKYKYDIAISFLHQDEPIARDLHGRLSPNFEVFVYFKKQKELAGTNGLESFKKVFLEDSRLVVVLYRDDWGETPWTRVEQGAITERFLKEGWDWLFFIMVDQESTPPLWLPKTKIRLNLPDYGIEQAVGAIKTRAEEVGSRFRKEDATKRARRLQSQVKWRAERKRLLDSSEGVASVEIEVKKVQQEIAKLCEEINGSTEGLNILSASDSHSTVITNKRVSVVIYFYVRYTNTLDQSNFLIQEMNGRVLLPQERGHYTHIFDPKELATQQFDPDITPDKEWCWLLKNDPNGYYSSKDLADYCLSTFLALADREDKGEIPSLKF